MIDIRKENNKKCIVYIDGASSGNPGKAGIGVYIKCSSKEKRISECIGIKTNNQAEYSALIKALEFLLEKDIKKAIIRSDSRLVVNQMNGKFKVKAKKVIPLYNKAKELANKLEVVFEWVEREKNKVADSLAKEAIKKC